MGYRDEHGGWRPGISAFKREGQRILRVSDAVWSPGDDFCTVWHFFDLLPEGAAGWSPKFTVAQPFLATECDGGDASVTNV
jgi:hypothetical protein